MPRVIIHMSVCSSWLQHEGWKQREGASFVPSGIFKLGVSLFLTLSDETAISCSFLFNMHT